ncbi:hypothetical protein X975_01789, partial [Stegodyphus mimosarum]
MRKSCVRSPQVTVFKLLRCVRRHGLTSQTQEFVQVDNT